MPTSTLQPDVQSPDVHKQKRLTL